MKIAFVTTDGFKVDEHFGRAGMFAIYEFKEDSFKFIMNIILLIPQAEFEYFQRPSREIVNKLRNRCRGYIRQMTHCRQCRADACGTLGRK